MEDKTCEPDHQVAEKGSKENPVVAVPNTAGDALMRKVYKGQICEGIDNLGAVDSGIIILPTACQSVV